MIFYHGTNAVIQNIDLSQSRVGKDFGLGFYLTPDKMVAQRQAERKNCGSISTHLIHLITLCVFVYKVHQLGYSIINIFVFKHSFSPFL